MAVHGEERIERAIFADTQDEPKAVYDWLETLMPIAERAGIPVDVVTAGRLSEKILHGERAPALPVFTRNDEGHVGILGRQCTRDFKIRPIRRHLQKIRGGQTVEQLLGISLDEVQRMRDSDVRYIRNVYPLVDRRMSRQDCLRWLERHGYPAPPKSACVFCPYRSPAPISASPASASRHPRRARSGLFFDLIRIVRDVRPRYLFLENVAAITLDGLDAVLGELAESGFDAEWGCLERPTLARHIAEIGGGASPGTESNWPTPTSRSLHRLRCADSGRQRDAKRRRPSI
jgi:hypothetical protein